MGPGRRPVLRGMQISPVLGERPEHVPEGPRSQVAAGGTGGRGEQHVFSSDWSCEASCFSSQGLNLFSHLSSGGDNNI